MSNFRNWIKLILAQSSPCRLWPATDGYTYIDRKRKQGSGEIQHPVVKETGNSVAQQTVMILSTHILCSCSQYVFKSCFQTVVNELIQQFFVFFVVHLGHHPLFQRFTCRSMTGFMLKRFFLLYIHSKNIWEFFTFICVINISLCVSLAHVHNTTMLVWSSWKLVWESRILRGTLPSRPHPDSDFDSVRPDTTHRSGWSGHTCDTTTPLSGNEHSYLVTQQKKINSYQQKRSPQDKELLSRGRPV